MSTIDRVRYYDGEFLRAFDFSDEQTYHMEMRRRLNRYLHLYGIVQGLQLNDDNQAGVHQVSILPGMAIDALGREIYVFAPYILGDTDLTNNRISKPGNYDVWLRYSKTPATPPSAGFAVCNQPNQYTRWLESFTVVILTSPSNPFTAPTFADDDTDSPSQDGVGVLLGRVYIDPSSGTKQFSQPFFDDRLSFVGITAQRIRAPYDTTQSFNFQGKNSALSPLTSLEIEPNIFADQNLILGPDFDLQTTPQTTVPAPTTPGSAKIAGDVFLLGDMYSSVVDGSGNPQWLGLAAYIQQLQQQAMPDFVSTLTPTFVTPNPLASGHLVAGVFTDTVPIVLDSKVTVTRVQPSASIGGIQFNVGVNLNQLQLLITAVSGSPGPLAKQCTISVNYTVSPGVTLAFSPILSFAISATAVCFS